MNNLTFPNKKIRNFALVNNRDLLLRKERKTKEKQNSKISNKIYDIFSFPQ